MKDVAGLKVAVLYGGPSSERDISIKSGKAVGQALESKGCVVRMVDAVGDFFKQLEGFGPEQVFIALHGKFGEDGTVQRLLEEAGYAYTGSGPEGCSNAMDKVKSRRLLEAGGVWTPRWWCFDDFAQAMETPVNYPVFVKPALGGSSIGVSLVRGFGEWGPALREAFAEDRTVLVEASVSGREFAVGILGSRVLPPVEIVSAGDFFDFEAKYNSGGTRYVFPEDLYELDRESLCGAALKAHRLLGCEAFSRADLILSRDEAGASRIHVLEVNAIPGLTSRSLLPTEARKAGITFEDLCVMILRESGICRKTERSSMKER